MEYLFETDRLRIRKFEQEDAKRLYEYHLDEEVKKWFPNECYEDMEEALGAIEFFSDCVTRKELPYVLAIELRETGELIGDTGINEAEDKTDEVEIGYVISSEQRGKGYATEVVKAMTEFIASAFRIRTLYGRVIKGNEASVRVLEKSGYGFVAEESGAEDDPYGNGMLVYRKDVAGR